MEDFRKMHGLGNDFVIFDWRQTDKDMPEAAARLIADRRHGIGCDQIMILRQPREAGDIFLEMLNADGSQTGACGNGTRCVADLMLSETDAPSLVIETISGNLTCWRTDSHISVDMGPPKLEWQQIPVAQKCDTKAVILDENLPLATCVSMGNPHAVLFYDDIDALNQVDIAEIGRKLELHPMFPERANIEFVAKTGQDKLRMRVWERGAGITEACGSGACAVAVAAIMRGMTGRDVSITLDGGMLQLSWPETGDFAGHVIMTGPVSYVARGILSDEISKLITGS